MFVFDILQAHRHGTGGTGAYLVSPPSVIPWPPSAETEAPNLPTFPQSPSLASSVPSGSPPAEA